MVGGEVNRSYTSQDTSAPQGDRSLLAATTNPETIMNDIEHKLRGEKFNPVKKKWYRPKGMRPKANELGISSIISKLALTLNQNTILSNIQPKEANSFMGAFAEKCDMWLCMNRKRFGIDWEDMEFCSDSIIDPTFFAVKRAVLQGEKRFIQNTLQQKEQVSVLQQPRPQGVLNKFFGK